MRRNCFLFGGIIVLMLSLSACGSSSSSSDSSDGSDSGGDSGGETAVSGFNVTGTLTSLAVSPSIGKSDSVSGTITDVMAVSPGTGSVSCKKVAVESDGSFRIGLTGGKPWFLFFFDRFKTGFGMFMGRLKTTTLDTLLPTDSTGSTDLGNVTVDAETAEATSDVAESDILADMGVTEETAATVGNIDDVATRYANPDADGNGEADCSDEDASAGYMLDFHIRFDMKENGTQATIADLIDDYLSDTATTATYSSTGIYVAYPTIFSSATTGSATFVDSAVTTSEGGAIPANTATASVTENSFSGYYGFGPNIVSASELPSGEIKFSMGDKILTFSNVQTPSLATLTAPTGRIFPFIKFNKTNASCTSNCTMSGIGYKWMKKSDSGWSAATLAEISLLVANGTISFYLDNNSSKYITFSIPVTAVDGTIEWTSSNAGLGTATAAEFTAMATTQLCHLGLSYDDKLGMRYFESISDAAGTCVQ